MNICMYCNEPESAELGELKVTLGDWLHFPWHTYLRLKARREAGENIPGPIWEQAVEDAKNDPATGKRRKL